MDLPAGRLTALPREIDLATASNRFAVVAASVATLVGLVTTLATAPGASVPSAIGRGLAYGVGTFLVWATTRELHPDEPRAAQLAVLAYAPAAFLGPPALAAATALLMAARITLRSTGRPPTDLDLVAMVALAGFAATSAVGLVAGLGLAWAIHDDRRLPRPAPDQRHELAAIAAAAVAIATTVITSSAFTTDWRLPSVAEVVWLVIVVAAVTRLGRPRTLDSVADHDHQPLDPHRLHHARWTVIAVLGVAVVWVGGAALPALAPTAAAVVGTALAAPRFLRPRDRGTPMDAPTGPA